MDNLEDSWLPHTWHTLKKDTYLGHDQWKVSSPFSPHYGLVRWAPGPEQISSDYCHESATIQTRPIGLGIDQINYCFTFFCIHHLWREYRWRNHLQSWTEIFGSHVHVGHMRETSTQMKWSWEKRTSNLPLMMVTLNLPGQWIWSVAVKVPLFLIIFQQALLFIHTPCSPTLYLVQRKMMQSSLQLKISYTAPLYCL